MVYVNRVVKQLAIKWIACVGQVVDHRLSLSSQKGKKPFRSLRNLKADLDLMVEGDLNIIMALAEKLRAGLHSFVFGKPFYTSMQERDVLMNFWVWLSPARNVLKIVGFVCLFCFVFFVREIVFFSDLEFCFLPFGSFFVQDIIKALLFG